MRLSTGISQQYFSLPLLYMFTYLQRCLANDVFCGNLTVYQRKWSPESSKVLASRTTPDLKQCLHICCSLANCQGVTFVGVVEKKIAQENCLLIGCYGECQFESESDLTEGVSVKITRTASNQDGSSKDVLSTQPPKINIFPDNLFSVMTPIWTISLIAVVSVLCIGLNIALISAYICWRRKKSRKRKAHISTITTLHAFNPT